MDAGRHSFACTPGISGHLHGGSAVALVGTARLLRNVTTMQHFRSSPAGRRHSDVLLDIMTLSPEEGLRYPSPDVGFTGRQGWESVTLFQLEA